MATVTETVKEALLGVEEEPQLSDQTRQEFMKAAVKDEENGQYYMGVDQFTNAIAPAGEDYVSWNPFTAHTGHQWKTTHKHRHPHALALPIHLRDSFFGIAIYSN